MSISVPPRGRAPPQPPGCPQAPPWAVVDANDATGLGAFREPDLLDAAFSACHISRPATAAADVLLYNRRPARSAPAVALLFPPALPPLLPFFPRPLCPRLFFRSVPALRPPAQILRAFRNCSGTSGAVVELHELQWNFPAAAA